ncbi:hypothetical protein GCM10022225_19460 [Plantactinospora mayteni]
MADGKAATVRVVPSGADWSRNSRCAPAANQQDLVRPEISGRPYRLEGRAAMELFVPLFFLVLLVASMLGLTADSRDSADWRPSNGGWRSSPRG